MLRLLKQIVLAFKPISDAEAMRMNLGGPNPPKEPRPNPWHEVDKLFKGPNSGMN